MDKARPNCGLTDEDPSWCLDDQSFEKMGSLLSENHVFYMKARARIPDSASDPWYTAFPVGHNTLDKFLKQILAEANIDTTNKSNHSLRATAISRMYQRSVPEKLIME